jgi:hypothetical protein
MRSIAPALLLVIACRIPPAAPSGPERVPCTRDCVEGRSSGLDGKGNPVSRLARSFLPADGVEAPFYKLHVYLYFGARDDASLPERSAAASAVLALFDDRSLRPARPRDTGERLAALLVPIKSDGAAVAVLRRKQDMVDAYDYDRAFAIYRAIESATGTSLPRVALIAHPGPLGVGRAVDRSQLFTISFEGMSERQAQTKLLQLRDVLVARARRLDDVAPSWETDQDRSFLERALDALNQ